MHSTDFARVRGYIFEGEEISNANKICRVTDGLTNLEALRNIFQVSERALFEWIISAGTFAEGQARLDSRYMQWLWDIADHSSVCLENDGATQAVRHFLIASMSQNLVISVKQIDSFYAKL